MFAVHICIDCYFSKFAHSCDVIYLDYSENFDLTCCILSFQVKCSQSIRISSLNLLLLPTFLDTEAVEEYAFISFKVQFPCKGSRNNFGSLQLYKYASLAEGHFHFDLNICRFKNSSYKL